MVPTKLDNSRLPAEAAGDADQVFPAPDPRAVALLPGELLQPGEVIILLLKPSPWYILLESLRALAILGVLAMLFLSLAARGYPIASRADITLLFVGLGLIRLFWQFLEWLSRVYVLTDRRVVRVQGVLRVLVFEAQLKQIQHTQVVFSVRERFFGLGTITFATAGTAGIEAAWRMVAQPLDVHQTIVRAINRYR